MGNRVLLADDSITIQKVVAIIFANEEFELTVVDNGTAALEKARAIEPDVMLVDALMPGKSGYEVCSEIRRDPKLGAIPLLLLIGAFEPLDEEKARSCGADATISKPFESQQLIEKVKELLELGKSRKSAPAPPAQAAQAAPAEPSADDLWADLSSLDTMAQPAPAAPAYAAPAQPQREEPAPAPPQAAPQAAAPPVAEEIVEASLEDDLWGAFELEEEPQAPAAAPADVFGVVEPEAEFEAEEFFSFEEDSEGIEETGPALELVEEPVVQPEAEELFAFEEEEVPLEQPEPEPFQLPEYEPFALEPEPEEAFAAEPGAPAPPAQAAAAPAQAAAAPAQAAAAPAPAEEEVPVLEPQGTPAYHFEAPVAEGAAVRPAPLLTEEALREALSKISKEVIERIVWEVVPDLAEVLIKEEIKKLKAGVRG